VGIIKYLVIALGAYLLGAIPSGYLVGRLWKGIDIREYGSGRTGGANVLRSLGVVAATLTAIGDVGKGAVAVLLGRVIFHDEGAAALAGFFALAGHNWPVYLGWRGGAGVATTVGALVALEPLAVLISVPTGFLVGLISRYVSLGSIAFAAIMPLAMLFLALCWGHPWEHLIYGVLAAALIVFAHRPNILRLLEGTERKVGEPGRKREES
jgi:glycerol-3-phosphate acyltransferase PlsY